LVEGKEYPWNDVARVAENSSMPGMHLTSIVMTRNANESVKVDGRSVSLQPILPTGVTRLMHEGDGRRSIPIIGKHIESVTPGTKRITGSSSGSATVTAGNTSCRQMCR